MKPKRLMFSLALIVLLVSSLVLQVTPAYAAAGVNQDFRSGSASGWNLIGSATLTSGGVDPAGAGWLRLTDTGGNEAGSAIYNTAFSNTDGVQASFTYASYGGSGADGISFYLIDGATAIPTVGGTGGGLGYAWKHTTTVTQPGVTNGYIGISFDEYGNAANNFDTIADPYGTGGAGAGTFPGITVRGPGNLNDVGTFPFKTNAAATIQTGSRAGAKNVTITITPSPTQKLTVAINGTTYINNLDISSYTMPATFKMGFSSSTGGSTNFHEIRDLTVTGTVASGTVVVTSGSPSVVGNSVTFTATVTGSGATPTGNVAFYDGATYLGTGALNGAGVATLFTSVLAVGGHTITAKYLGDSTYTISQGTVGQTVIACSAPTVTNVNPAVGPTVGGTAVVITGNHFNDAGCVATSATFGGFAATTFTVISTTQINATTPAHAAGLVDVDVIAPGGTGIGTGLYTYVPPPTLLNIYPPHGPWMGGQSVTLYGTNLTGGAFTFGGVAAVCTVNVAGTQATCTTPPYTPAAVNVVVTTVGGTATLVNGYTYLEPAFILPATGFAPGVITRLPAQPAAKAYSGLGDLWLEIPKLGVQMSIVGVPQAADGSWDVSWLGNNAGWLNGSAYPTWKGNSVITGHVWNANNTPGPFRYINTLFWGDKIIVHAGGAQYVYEVRSVMQVSSGNTAAMLKHETLPWVTLVTCRDYNQTTGTYKYRVLVRAVLVDVK